MLHDHDCHRNCLYALDCVVGFPLADEEEDEDVHSLRECTKDLPGSSATKRRTRQIIKSLAKKVVFMFL